MTQILPVRLDMSDQGMTHLNEPNLQPQARILTRVTAIVAEECLERLNVPYLQNNTGAWFKCIHSGNA